MMRHRIEIDRDPETNIPRITLLHPLWIGVEIPYEGVDISDDDAVRRLAEIHCDTLDGDFEGIEVVRW